MFKACIGLNCTRQIDFIDRRGCQLVEVPDEIYRHESYLEELLLDSNSIHELPPKLFRLTNLRRLTLSENDIMRLPPMIANFSRLLELDISKNCIEEIPSNLQFCRSLSYFDCSCNPLMRIPDCITNVTCLTQLFLNDVGLPALPREIGNLQSLIILEARENLLRRVPLSIGELKKLERLDLGNNEIEALPSSVGFLHELVELWLDCNCLSLLPEELSNLTKLTVLDVTKNKLERLPSNFARLVNLNDLHASENCIEVLPDDFGCLRSLTQLKLDLNHLMSLPDSIGNIPNLVEVFLFENMLESIPPSFFSIPTLNMLNLDRNHLIEIPSNVGQCKSLHILSLRENDITFLPEEIGNLKKLRVLDVSGNRITNFPSTLSNLNLDALWVSGSQLQPLVSLQQVPDPENPDKRVLTCQFLPQKGQYGSELDYEDGSEEESDGGVVGNSFQRPRSKSNPTAGQLTVAFEPGTAGLPPAEDISGGKLVRFPTPFRKDLKNRHKKPKLDARPRTTVFRKGSMDDLTIHAVDLSSSEEPSPSLLKHVSTNETTALPQLPVTIKSTSSNSEGLPSPAPLSGLNKMQGVMNLSADYLSEDPNKSASQSEENVADKKPAQPRTKLKTIEVSVELLKDPNRGLGFSIAGGKGSTPAYEDVDESVFVTRIIRGGAAEKDGRLRLGDKVLSVNNQDMTEASHMQAVTALRNSHKRCVLKVSREVLIVLPDNASFDDEEEFVEGAEGLGEGQSTDPSLVRGQERSTDSLPATSTVVVTEESTGQRVEPVQNHKEPIPGSESEKNENQTEVIGVVSSSHKRTSSNNIGEAVLLDSDGENESQPTKDDEAKKDEQMIVKASSELSLGILDTEMSDDDEDTKSEQGDIVGERRAYEKESDRSDSGLGVATNNYEETVVLDRSIPILGMSIVGGVDYSCKLFGCGNPGIYISKVSEGGSAAATGKLKIGDKILKVNGIDMESVTHEEAVMCLVSQEGNIELHVRHEPPPPGLQEVIINKSGNKLGVSIKGGGPESVGNPFDPSDEGIFISKISKGGVAESDGRLQVGQRILEVDGHSLLGATHVEAVHVLRQTGNVVRLLVSDGFGFYNRQGVIRPLDKDLRTGSMELIDIKDTKKHANVKRTQSTASSDLLRSPYNKKAESVSEFNRVLANLTRYQEEISSMIPEKNDEAQQHPDTTEEEKDRDEDKVMETVEIETTTKDHEQMQHVSIVAEINEVIDEIVNEVESKTNKDEQSKTADKEEDKDEVKLDESNNSNSNSNIDIVGEPDSDDDTAPDRKDSIGLHRRDNADEVARQRAEKQEELKSIISEVFSDLDEWEILGKVSDTEKTDDEIPNSVQELVGSPPSASELSDSSITPVEDHVQEETTEEKTESHTEKTESNAENTESNTEKTESSTKPPTTETVKDIDEKENNKERVGVSPDLTIQTIQQVLLRGSAHSVPPTPTKPLSYQREWSIERPLSAQGSIDKVQTTQKPTNFKAPEKLSFKDKLALHQKKVQTVSREVEDEMRMKRRSWAPVPGPSGGITIPLTSHSNTNSPTVSPTHKLFSSMSLTAPTVKVNKMSPEREQIRLMRYTTSAGHVGESSTTNPKPNSVLTSSTTTSSIDIPFSSAADSDTSDTVLSPAASDPPLTDSSTTPTSLTGNENEFAMTVPATKDFNNSTNTTTLSIDLENNSLLSNNQN